MSEIPFEPKPRNLTVLHAPVNTGTVELRVIKDRLEDMRGLIGGGYIEIVHNFAPIDDSRSVAMVCDEEGLLKELPPNFHLYDASPPRYIAGDAFFCEYVRGDEDLHSISAKAARLLARMFGRRFTMRCRVCGCTDDRACDGGCSWARPCLCSKCAGKGDGKQLDQA